MTTNGLKHPGTDTQSVNRIGLIAAWGLRRNLRSLRFLFAVIICGFLGVAGGYFGSQRLVQQIDEYEAIREAEDQRLSRARMIVQAMPVALRSPSEGSILASGAGSFFGSAALLPAVFGQPIYWNPYTVTNPFLLFQSGGGFASLSMAILILIAFLLTFDAVAAEDRGAALRLVLSYGVRRRTYLLGMFVAGLITLLVPLLIGFLLALLVTGVVGFNLMPSHSVIAGFLILSGLTLAAATLMGLAVSSFSSSARGSLLTLVVLWVSIVWVWPTVSTEITDHFWPIVSEQTTPPPRPSAANEAILNKLPRRATNDASSTASTSAGAVFRTYLHKSSKIADLNDLAGQLQLKNFLSHLSIFEIYRNGVEAACGTGADSYLSFVNRCRMENRQLASWHLGLIEESPSQCYVWTNLDSPLPMDDRSPVVAVSSYEGSLGQVIQSALALLVWVVLAAWSAAVGIERRSLVGAS